MAVEGKSEKGAKAAKKADAAAPEKAKPTKEELREEEQLNLEAEADDSGEESAREGTSEKPKAAPAKRPSKEAQRQVAASKEEDDDEDGDGGKGAKDEKSAKKGKPRPKAKVDAALKHSLELRAAKNKQRQEFHRQEWFRYQRLGDKWRAPGGIQSKMRRHWGTHADVVSIGYRGPKAARGLHPSGFKEVLIHNPDGLEGVDPAREAVRIASSVGKQKRVAIQKAAVKRGIRVLNWRQY